MLTSEYYARLVMDALDVAFDPSVACDPLALLDSDNLRVLVRDYVTARDRELSQRRESATVVQRAGRAA